jgi:hypothetical protein
MNELFLSTALVNTNDGCLLEICIPDGGSEQLPHSDRSLRDTVGPRYDRRECGSNAVFLVSMLPGSDQRKSNHVFVVMEGDVTHMFNDCQDRFQ